VGAWSDKVGVSVTRATPPTPFATTPPQVTSATTPNEPEPGTPQGSPTILLYGQDNLTLSVGAEIPGASARDSLSWDWGDGSTPSTSPLPAHRYAAPGKYRISLTVRHGDTSAVTVVRDIALASPATPAAPAAVTASPHETPGPTLLAILAATLVGFASRRRSH
jgi:hypothetical protein